MIVDLRKSEVDGYEKKIYFKGTDSKDYRIVFYTLTNYNDIEVDQYIKSSDGV